MGIDAGAFAEAAQDVETIALGRALRAGQTQVLVGIDRLDYTKNAPLSPLTAR